MEPGAGEAGAFESKYVLVEIVVAYCGHFCRCVFHVRRHNLDFYVVVVSVTAATGKKE